MARLAGFETGRPPVADLGSEPVRAIRLWHKIEEYIGDNRIEACLHNVSIIAEAATIYGTFFNLCGTFKHCDPFLIESFVL